MESTEYLIVGSGLAGITLAHTLEKQGLRFKIIAKPELSKCSQVAAGIYNPVVFYRITKSYMADAVLPFALSFYGNIELKLMQKLLYPHPVAKIFANENESQLWEKRREEGVGHYLGEHVPFVGDIDRLNSAFGFGLVNQTGSLDCETFLSASLEYFKPYWLNETFQYADLKHNHDGVEYHDIEAKNVIFCEGHLIANNPFFNAIELKPVKGEILIVEFEDDLPTEEQELILNKKCYLLPIENRQYIVGATYNWNTLNDEISTEGLEELSKNIREITQIKFKVLRQTAGVRPASADRRPIIGMHPSHPSLFLFNGLGTKGVMLAPYYANELLQLMTLNQQPHKEVSIARYLK